MSDSFGTFPSLFDGLWAELWKRPASTYHWAGCHLKRRNNGHWQFNYLPGDCSTGSWKYPTLPPHHDLPEKWILSGNTLATSMWHDMWCDIWHGFQCDMRFSIRYGMTHGMWNVQWCVTNVSNGWHEMWHDMWYYIIVTAHLPWPMTLDVTHDVTSDVTYHGLVWTCIPGRHWSVDIVSPELHSEHQYWHPAKWT